MTAVGSRGHGRLASGHQTLRRYRAMTFNLRSKGFSLIEVIGVMSVMAILASVIAPSVFDDIKRARQDKESKHLVGMAEYLEHYILDNKRIPTRTVADWTQSIAGQGTLPADKIEFNELGFRRGYYVDPRFFTGSDTAFPGYTQTTGLGTAPVSPRIMLVSSLTGNAPAAPTTAAAYNAIWDQTVGATLVEGPETKIERVNLRSIFHRVILTNENTNQPSYQLETGAASSLPAAAGGVDGLVTRWVIDKTRVNLFRDPFPGGSLDHVVLVDQQINYAYQDSGGTWVWQKP